MMVLFDVHLQCQYNDYLGFSIFNLLCCCLCIGIFALMKSLAVRSANNVGDVETAKRESQAALRLNKIGLGKLSLHSHLLISALINFSLFN